MGLHVERIKSLRRDFAMIGAVLLLSLAVTKWWLNPIRQTERVDPSTISFLIDPNTADEIQLQLLPGIGETTAKRIVDDRAANGPFKTADDLVRVYRVGPKLVERIEPYLTFQPARPQKQDSSE